METIELCGLQMLYGLEPVCHELLKEERLEFAKMLCPTWIYQVIYGRNAWHSTWVQIYDEENFHLEFEAAKESAENRRVQGSKWTIEELPALAFVGERHTLVVTEINSDRPLFHSGYSPKCPPSLSSIARAFFPVRDNSILRFLTAKSGFPKLVPELREFSSISRGGDSLLDWQEHRRHWDVTSFKKHRRSFSQSMFRCAFLGVVTAESSIKSSIEIVEMHKQSPLRAEGICIGDVVTGISGDGESVSPLWLALRKAIPGQILEMTVRRGQKEFRVRHRVKSFREVFG